MDSATAALWALVGTLLISAATVVPPLFALIRDRIEAERKKLAREAAFDAASVIEEQSRKAPMSGETKLQLAVDLANKRTSDRVTVTTDDVQAALPRVRASMPTPPSLPPLPLPVTVVSSEPPASEAALEHPTLPRPAPMPRDTSREKAPLR